MFTDEKSNEWRPECGAMWSVPGARLTMSVVGSGAWAAWGGEPALAAGREGRSVKEKWGWHGQTQGARHGAAFDPQSAFEVYGAYSM